MPSTDEYTALMDPTIPIPPETDSGSARWGQLIVTGHLTHGMRLAEIPLANSPWIR